MWKYRDQMERFVIGQPSAADSTPVGIPRLTLPRPNLASQEPPAERAYN